MNYSNLEDFNIWIYVSCFVDHASWYNHVKKNQLDAQLILSIFCQPLHFWTYLGPSSGGKTICLQQLVLIILFRWLSVVVLVGWNMWMMMKYTKNKLCIKLVFLYTMNLGIFTKTNSGSQHHIFEPTWEKNMSPWPLNIFASS